MKFYEAIIHVACELRGKNIKPETASPVISQFRNQLLAWRYDHPPLKIYPVVVDEFQFQEIDTTLLRVSWQIRFNIWDSDNEGWVNRMNNSIQPILLNGMLEQKMSNGLRYGRQISILVVDVRLHGNPTNHPNLWPVEKVVSVVAG